jgi:hypothetical protein
MAVYPEYEWLPWKFINTPKNCWSDLKIQRKFLDWVSQELKLKDMNGWYDIPLKVTYFVTIIYFHRKSIPLAEMDLWHFMANQSSTYCLLYIQNTIGTHSD